VADFTIRPQVGTYVPASELREVADAISRIDVHPSVDVQPGGVDAPPPRSGVTEQVVEVVLNEGTQIALGAAVGAVTSWAREKRSKRAAKYEVVRIVDEQGHILREVVASKDPDVADPEPRARVACPVCEGDVEVDAVRCRNCGHLLV
jgi:hypothetical protein